MVRKKTYLKRQNIQEKQTNFQHRRWNSGNFKLIYVFSSRIFLPRLQPEQVGRLLSAISSKEVETGNCRGSLSGFGLPKPEPNVGTLLRVKGDRQLLVFLWRVTASARRRV